MSKTPSPVNSILIVGGGTAGWLAAAYLSQELGSYRDDGVKITLVEASDIPTIGVGEGTFPSLRRTLSLIGVTEGDFIRECDATFKQAVQFDNWKYDPAVKPHTYYHLFEEPRLIGGHVEIAPYWCLQHQDKGDNAPSFAEAVSVQADMIRETRAPKRPQDKDWSGTLNYAYHLDAGKMAEFLKKRAKFARVEHVVAEITDVQKTASGDIDHVVLKDGKTLTADLYIDCSGFSGLLIEKTMGADYTSVSDHLFVDRAITTRVPHASPTAPIASATVCTAHEGGWIWDIGLRHRRGVGLVYSSQHMEKERAETVFHEYLDGIDHGADTIEPRHITMKTGYRPKPWIGNCVAIGLSGGFLEPLEATGIALTEASLRLLADYFPRSGRVEAAAERFNRNMVALYENAVTFIKMHYALSERDDTQFWRDNRNPDTWPQELKDYMELWAHNVPQPSDFERWQKTFGYDSFQYIMFGLGYAPDLKHNASGFGFAKDADAEFQRIRASVPNFRNALPTHRELIESLQKN